ncbi:putative integral membrane protein [Minicystis rosea]|nr:putative integral membrane protein [Minicystis rosea]
MFESLGAFVHRRRHLVLLLAFVFLAASAVLLRRGGPLTSGTIRDLESEHAQTLVEEILGHPSDTTFVAIIQSPDLVPGSEAHRDAVRRALAPLRTDARVLSITTPDDAPTFLAAGLMNVPAHAALALITLRGDVKEALAAYPAVRAEIQSGPLTVTCTGHVPFVSDMNHTLARDLLRAELISLPLALLVLLAVFRTTVAAALPVGVGGLAVVGGIAVVLGIAQYTDIAEYTINVCSLLGLGLAIDYSLFTVSRYREELAKDGDYPAALQRTLATAGRVVAFSGLAVGTGLSGLLFFEGSYLRPMGIGGAVVVALAVIFALTFLPALLAVLGPRIHAGRLPLPRLAVGEGFWHRIAMWVMRHPVRVLVPTLAVLLAMGTPFFRLRLSAADVRVLTADVEARRGYDLLQRDFPDQAAERALVAVRFPTAPALTEDRVGALYDLSRRLAAIPHVRRVESLVNGDPALTKEDYQDMLVHPMGMHAAIIEAAKRLTVSDHVVTLNVVIDAPADSEAAREVIHRIREERRVGDGTLLVGGRVAKDVDATDYVLSRAPRAVAFVVVTTLVILFLLLGSVILPIKAMAMNFVSIAGSFGALVWIFQEGHLFVREPRPLEPALPILLFCVLFGLSMDYEVLMLSRIKEAWERTGDDVQSVAEGLEKTAGLITSAAAIMVAVFAAFATARVVVIQAVGLGMALAVALDATLVRVLLVPSTMRLLGHLNWWAPRPLDALRIRLGLGSHRSPHGATH